MTETMERTERTGRDKLTDCLKGYACLLVVLGSVLTGLRNAGNVALPVFSEPLEKFLWTFLAPLFAFLSGYVYQITDRWRSKNGRKRFLLRKLLNLGVPYLVFSVIYILVGSAVNGLIGGTNFETKFSDILWLWKDSVGQYWYLYALFFLFVVYALLDSSLKDYETLVLLALACFAGEAFGMEFGSFERGMALAFAFGLGVAVPNLVVDRQKLPIQAGTILVHLVVVSVLVFLRLQDITPVGYVAQVLGIAASIAFISLLTRVPVVQKALLGLCRFSFPIYLLHTFFTAGTRILLNEAGIHHYWIHLAAGLCLGVAAPLVIALLASRVPMLDFFFYPTKNLPYLKAMFAPQEKGKAAPNANRAGEKNTPKPYQRATSLQRTVKVTCSVLLVLAVFCASTYLWSWYEGRHIDLSYYSVSSEKVDEPVRAVLLSDLHQKSFGTGNWQLVEQIRELAPDIILISGDTINSDSPNIAYAVDLCAQLQAIAPVYFGMGNHENRVVYGMDLTKENLDAMHYSSWDKPGDFSDLVKNSALLDGLAGAGVTVLQSSYVETEIKGNSFVIGGLSLGVDASWMYSSEFLTDMIEASDEHCTVLMSHFPNAVARSMAGQGLDLIVAGHNHGGQIRIPGLGGLYAYGEGFFPENDEGMRDLKGTAFIISRGLGNHGWIPRLFNPPELIVIDLM